MEANVTEIRWHARGGQGAVTAAKTLAEMSLTKDMFFQAFPEYGPERMGAPIQCFNRLSEKPISTYCGVTEPEIVVVVDPTLLEVVDVSEGLAPDGLIIVNSEKNPARIREEFSIKGRKIFTVDATTISIESLGRFMPNVPILGALLKVTGLLTLEEATDFLKQSFTKKFSEKVVTGNLKALQRAFEEVRSE